MNRKFIVIIVDIFLNHTILKICMKQGLIWNLFRITSQCQLKVYCVACIFKKGIHRVSL